MGFLSDDEVRQMLSGVTYRVAGDLLTLHFPNGSEEVWTLAPPDYPIDGSLEVMRFDDRYFVPPLERGTAS